MTATSSVTERPGAPARRVPPAIPRRRRPPLPAAAATAAMATPAVALYTALLAVPLLLSVYYSFTDWSGYGGPVGLVGLDNYRAVLADPDMRRAITVTVILTVVCTVVVNLVALGLAVLLALPGRAMPYYRAAIFYPYVVSAIIAGFLWSAILNPDGAVNRLLGGVGISGAPFLSDGTWALGSLIGVTVWSTLGFSLVLYLSGLQTIPAELVEAARIDGANAWQVFRYVTVPLLRSTVTINVVLVGIGLLRTYELVLSLTAGGPAGATQTIGFEILAVGYANGRLGYASAGSVLLFLATIVLAGIVTVLRRRNAGAA